MKFVSAHVSVMASFQGRLNTEIVLRTCRQADIDSVVQYFETEKPELFEAVGVDLRFLPPIENVRADLISLCADLDRAGSFEKFVNQSGFRVPLVFGLGGRLIGHLVLVEEEDSLTGALAWFAHSHIWSESDRVHGVGSAVAPLMIEFIQKFTRIPKLILEMSADNAAMICVLEKEMQMKDGNLKKFTRVPDYDRPAKDIARAMRVARFEFEF